MLILVIDDWRISCEIAIRWMQLDLTDDKSTLVQVMAWCRQVTSHYLSPCWPRSMSPNGVTRPQWVKCYSQVSRWWWIQIWVLYYLSKIHWVNGSWPHGVQPTMQSDYISESVILGLWCMGDQIMIENKTTNCCFIASRPRPLSCTDISVVVCW